jgi:hypothetical protein
MHLVALALLIAASATNLTMPAVSNDQPETLATTKTGKERLSDKASDEQRVDDCKVPPAQRTRLRPMSCNFPKPLIHTR